MQVDSEALRQAVSSMENSRSLEALARLERLVNSPAFAQMRSEERHAALYAAGVGAYNLKQFSRSVVLLVRSTALPEADPNDWYMRLRGSWSAEDLVDAIRSLTVIARRWPQALSAIDDRVMSALAIESGKLRLEDENRFRFLDALFNAHWKPNRLMPPSSWLWTDLALLLLDRNMLERATDVAAHVTGPRSLLAMKVDHRFDAVAKAMPERFDVERAAAKEIEQLRSEMRQAPRSLPALLRLSQSLQRSLKHQEALDLLDAALGQLKSEKPPHDDLDDELVWVMNHRSNALRGLGRWDEAVEELERASRLPERGHANVNQVINLAYLYCYLDRPKDALASVAQVTEASQYGWTQVWNVRVMAAVEMQDAEELSRGLDYLRQHASDSLVTLQSALVNANALDEASRLLVSRLADPNQRSDALVALQNYAEGPATPRMMQWRSQWKAAVARPEVQAAITAVGRVERFEIAPE